MRIEVEENDDFTEAQWSLIQTYLRAFRIVVKREALYGSAWTDYGVHDKAMHCRDIARRIDHMTVSLFDQDYTTRAGEIEKLEDLFLDLINYAAMGAVQVVQGKFGS